MTLDLADLPVIDGHCHPPLGEATPLTPETFPDLFTEARPGALTPQLATSLYYRRALRDLGGLLGVPPEPAAILAARATPDASRRLAEAFGRERLEALLVDTAYPPGAMPLERMRALLPCRVLEVFRLETFAEALLARALPFKDLVEAFADGVQAATRECIALKSIIAYRSGLGVKLGDRKAAEADYARLLAGDPSARRRLTAKGLLDHLLEAALELAAETGRVLQLHTGLGDPDLDLLQANPLLLKPILDDPRFTRVRLVLLHAAYPYVREAGYLAAVYPGVYVDLSLALPILGPAFVPLLRELLALAPTGKLLYGSDLGALPELYCLGAAWGRQALAEALGGLVKDGALGEGEAREAAAGILAENAARLYGLVVAGG